MDINGVGSVAFDDGLFFASLNDHPRVVLMFHASAVKGKISGHVRRAAHGNDSRLGLG